MDIIEITGEKIDVSHTLSCLANPTCGATACFIGTTRDNFEDKKVLHLSYEAYKPMALKELQKIFQMMKNKWSLSNIALIHRIGIVPVGEVSVIVAANSVHRKDALDAVSFGIDAVKFNVPIWKKEEYSDGTSNWKSNSDCQSISHIT